MRQSFKHAGSLMMAVLLALAGTVFTAGTASAVKLQNQLKSSTVTQACTGAQCAKDVVTIPANTFVDTYCVLGNFNVTYTGPSTGRGGLVNVSKFKTPGLQFTPCDDAGLFSQVGGTATNLGSCSGPCVNFGRVDALTSLRTFCELSTAPNRWVLVYVDTPGQQKAGFVRESALAVAARVPNCSSPF
jgi:hypothetical protein